MISDPEHLSYALRFTVSFEKPPPTENYFLGDLKNYLISI